MKIYLFLVISSLASCLNSASNNNSEAEVERLAEKDSIATISTPLSEAQLGVMRNVYIGCGYNYKVSKSEMELSVPRHREVDEIKKILSYSGIPLNFEIYSAEIENAVATIINNHRYIIYDPRLLMYSDQQSDSYWSSMSILAHEIGHHLSGHTLNNSTSNHQAELEADKFSGFVLYKMGAKLEQAINAMSLLGNEFDSETHPNKRRRIEAISEGWEEASRLRYEGALPPPPPDIPIESVFEYTKEMLWDEDALNDFRKYYEYNDDFFTGVISDIERQSNGSFALEIYIIETGKSWMKSVGSVDREKLWFTVDRPANGRDMGNVHVGWLLEIFKPGRKIKFAFIEEGSGSFKTLSYIKPLPSK
jgi:hypothetical protein